MHGPASHDVARHGREQGGNDSQKRIPQKEAPGRGGLLKVPPSPPTLHVMSFYLSIVRVMSFFRDNF